MQSRSPLELFLPHGHARAAIVLGAGCPATLAPEPALVENASRGAQSDLIVIAPSRTELRDSRWIQRVADLAALEISPDGLVYLLPARALALRRALVRRGLRAEATLLHVPDVRRSRNLVQLGTDAGRFALAGGLPSKRTNRALAAAAVRLPGGALLGPTGVVLRPAGGAALARWLFELDGSDGDGGSIVVTRTGSAPSGAVLLRFRIGDSYPDAVAKTSPRAGVELEALRAVAAGATAAGVSVPVPLATGQIDDTPVLLESTIRGHSAALLLSEGRLEPYALQERLTEWLARWGSSSAHVRALSSEDLTQRLLEPGRRLATTVSGLNGYLDHLAQLSVRARGARCPFVPSHNDLTAANVLLTPGGDMGVVDWEEACIESLPLTDFFYSAADAIAAGDGYRDRLRAFVACFGADPAASSRVALLRHRLVSALHVDEVVQEVAFHACWLHHAVNEVERRGGSEGSFGGIARTLAHQPERFVFGQVGR